MKKKSINEVICFHGIDGVGKTTTISNTVSRLSGQSTVEVKNWRPGLLPPLHRLFGKSPQTTQMGENLVIPRETAGKLSAVRLLYYAIDFILGAYVLDSSNRNKVVIYDRSYLDLFVNPERFGIRPSKLIDLIYRLIPKNSFNLLLYANPQEIFRRKPELPLQTLIVHQNRWLELFRKGKINWPIYVNRPPEAIAYEIVDLVTPGNEVFPEKITKKQQIEWLNSFFGSSKITSQKNHLLLSFRDGRGFLIEDKNINKLTNRLTMYAPANRKAKLYKRALMLSAKLGLSSLFFHQIAVDDSAIQRLIALVKQKIGYDGEVTYAVSLGAPGPRRKLVFCITDSNDRVLAYAKLANHPAAEIGLNNEAETLTFLNRQAVELPVMPKLVYLGDWENKRCSITTPLRLAGNNQASSRFLLTDNELLKTVTQFKDINSTCEPLSQSAFFRELSVSVSKIPTPYFKHLCEDALALAVELAGNQPMPFHFAHGDFTPWNMLMGESQIGLFDFEYALRSAPAGFDLLQYQLRKMTLIDRKPLPDIYREFASKNGWYGILDKYFQVLNFAEPQRSVAITVTAMTYLIHSLYIYGESQNIFEQNLKTYSYLLNSLFIDLMQKQFYPLAELTQNKYDKQ